MSEISIDIDIDEDGKDESFDSNKDTNPTNNPVSNQDTTSVILLKSIYENRPSTVFFPYPYQCGIERSKSRIHNCSEFEEKKFDLNYKCTS